MEEIEWQYPASGEEYLLTVRKQHRICWSLEGETREYWKQITSISSPPYDRERVDGGVPCGTDMKVEKWEEYGAHLQTEWNKLLAMRMEARGIISLLPDLDEQAVLREYYVLAHSYRTGCQVLHMGRSTFGRLHHSALQSFSVIYRQWMEENELIPKVGTNGTDSTGEM